MGFDLLRGMVLGAIQGLTEFLPVSSSGHLILTPVLFGWPDQGLAFDTVLHLGTLTALLWFFRNELSSILADRLLLKKAAVATVPAVVVGALFGSWIEANTRGAQLVAFNLATWGLVLLWADRRASDRTEPLSSVSWKQALAVGLAQPLALIPGTSRSGVTISAGLFAGLSRAAAARFSFFLSIPVTAAAGGYGLLKLMRQSDVSDGMLMLSAGFLAAAVSGVWAIRFLLRYVSTHRYDSFVFYRLALALAVLILV